MNSEELLASLSEPIEYWMKTRHSLSHAVIAITATKVVVLIPDSFRGGVKNISWGYQEIENVKCTKSFSRYQISIKTTHSIIEERFETESKEDADSLIEHLERKLSSFDGEETTDSIKKNLSQSHILEKSKQNIPDSSIEEQKTTAGLQSETNFSKKIYIEKAPEKQIEVQDELESTNRTLEKKEEHILDERIEKLQSELLGSWTWHTSLGCFSWVGLSVLFFFGATNLVCLGIFFGFVFFLKAMDVGNKSYYHNTIRPQIDNIMIHEGLNFEEFTRIALKVLPKNAMLRRYLIAESGIEDPEKSSD